MVRVILGFRYYVTSKVKRDILYRFGLVYTCSDGTKELFVSDRDKYLLIHGKDTVTFNNDDVCLGSSIETLRGAICCGFSDVYSSL